MKEKTLRVLEYYKIIDRLSAKTESSLGKAIVEKMYPETDLKTVESMQTETDEAVKILIKRGSPPLSGLWDVKSEVNLAEKGGTLSPGALLRISNTLRAARNIKSFLFKEDEEAKLDIIREKVAGLVSYREIENEIENAVIGEEELSDNASSTLKNIRRQIKIKNDGIKSKLNSIINSTHYRKYLQDAIITIREGRYVVPVKQEYRSDFKGIIHDQSSSGATLFIEPMDIVNLNNDLKELKLKEKAEIERILAELSGLVGEVSYDIKNNLTILAEIDFIFAKGKLSLDMKCTKPDMNDEGFVNLKSARHPLLDPREVVPTNFHIGNGLNTIVITGPNTGGKTVTLKTVGLLTLMAQSGLQIPANHGSSVGVFKNIFADIGDEQSIEQSLSTFSSHMTNIVDMLDNLEENSLVLFDELGAGTDPTEGAALAISILEYLKDRSIRTLATTHYSELKIYALSTEGVENASVEFDVETLRPTYRLLIGVPGKSNAFEISKRLGLKDYIIDKARELITKDDIEFEDILSNLEKDRREAEKAREESKRHEEELEKLKQEVKEQKRKLESNKEQIIIEAKREAKKILSNAKNQSDTVLKDIRTVWDEIEQDKKKKMEKAREKLKSSLDQIDTGMTEKIISKVSAKPLKSVKIGDEVRIVSFNQNGIVLSEVDSDGNVQVQIGVMKITVPLNTIEKSGKPSQTETSSYAKSMIKNKSRSVKTELDIRGTNIEEASIEVDKYLDDAYVSGLKEVTIIHGKGTGALRAGIEKMLKKHKHVRTYRIGAYGEGGMGVTIVELK
jgi:DNA mismatch repair protein MutS2